MLLKKLFNQLPIVNKKLISDISLSNDEVNIIQAKANKVALSYSKSNKVSAENMSGDLQSRIRGSGIDFEGNKPYQIGSDSRHINWRTYARTQQLYTNIYNEDKRPSLYLVLDQRRKMYFGTRKQLKIKQALNVAIHSIFSAIGQQHSVSGMQILNKPYWHSSYHGESSALSFIKSLNQAHLNQKESLNEPALNDILNKLQLKEGAELLIISDFHDMNDQTIVGLYHISKKHKINLVRILDPIEVALPKQGKFNITADSGVETLQLDCNNITLKNNYKNKLEDDFKEYELQCRNMGVEINQCLTTDDLFCHLDRT